MKLQESYRDHEILVEQSRPRRAADLAAADLAPATLHIDGEPVVTVQTSSGSYIASGFAYAPQRSLINLARRIIDYRELSEEGDRGGPEESGHAQFS